MLKKAVGGKLMFHRPLAYFIVTVGRILIVTLGHLFNRLLRLFNY